MTPAYLWLLLVFLDRATSMLVTNVYGSSWRQSLDVDVHLQSRQLEVESHQHKDSTTIKKSPKWRCHQHHWCYISRSVELQFNFESDSFVVETTIEMQKRSEFVEGPLWVNYRKYCGKMLPEEFRIYDWPWMSVLKLRFSIFNHKATFSHLQQQLQGFLYPFSLHRNRFRFLVAVPFFEKLVFMKVFLLLQRKSQFWESLNDFDWNFVKLNCKYALESLYNM